jgi:uncharacterized membrane protein
MRRQPLEKRVSTQSLSTDPTLRRIRPRRVFSREHPAPAIPYAAIALRMAGIGAAIGALVYGPAILHARVQPGGVPLPHLPNMALIAEAPVVVQAHLATLSGAVLVGVVLMAGVKGSALHRTLGWAWSVFMLATAVVTLFIPASEGLPHIGPFGPLHIFSAVVLTLVPLAIYSARKGKLVAHGQTMTNVFFGGLVIAGAFAFAPGRLMWDVWFG